MASDAGREIQPSRIGLRGCTVRLLLFVGAFLLALYLAGLWCVCSWKAKEGVGVVSVYGTTSALCLTIGALYRRRRFSLLALLVAVLLAGCLGAIPFVLARG